MFKRPFYIAYLAIALVLLAALLVDHRASPKKLSYKVYECLNFDDNTEDLREHIAKLENLVDHFVILKTLQKDIDNDLARFEACKSALTPYSDKIIYLISPEDKDFRGAYLKALMGCLDSDIILFSDSYLTVKPSELKEGIVWLESHPNHSLILDSVDIDKSRALKPIEAATYAYVKAQKDNNQSPIKLKDQKKWKKFFFPF